MNIRRYAAADRPACLQILRSNVPTYFGATEESDFAKFLDQHNNLFWVADTDRAVVGCGGLAPDHPEAHVATLCWGMVAADTHHRGIGGALLKYRLRVLAAEYSWIERVQVNTTQLVQGFFERHGFVQVSNEPDAYGPGLNQVRMRRAVGAAGVTTPSLP